MRVLFRFRRQPLAGIEIKSRHMADECRAGKSKESSGEADDFDRCHGVRKWRPAEFPRSDLLDIRKPGTDVRIHKDYVLCSSDIFRKLRHKLLDA
jgi:hypothetical protein